MKIKVKYFAALREQAGKSEEYIEGEFDTADELFDHLNEKYNFSLKKENLKVAINEEYKEFKSDIYTGDIIVFIPPVAGG